MSAKRIKEAMNELQFGTLLSVGTVEILPRRKEDVEKLGNGIYAITTRFKIIPDKKTK